MVVLRDELFGGNREVLLFFPFFLVQFICISFGRKCVVITGSSFRLQPSLIQGRCARPPRPWRGRVADMRGY